MIRRALVLGVALCLPLFLTSDIGAYKYEGVHWKTPSMNYLINNSVKSWSTQIKNGHAAWTNAGSKFKFVYKGNTNAGVSWDQNSIDNKNVITKGALSGSQYQNTLALNHAWYYTSSKELVDVDIIFNTKFPWSTSGSSSAYDVLSIITHESGHSLQLKDLYGNGDKEKTMYGYASKGETKKRTLHSDDIAGIKKIYGAKK